MEQFRTLFFVASVAALLAVASSHSNPLIQARIIGGSAAATYQFTYQVSIRHEKDNICSGAILAERWIITAASCVESRVAKDLKVLYGSRLLNDGESTNVAQIIRHPKFNQTSLDNNIGMLFTSKKITFVSFMVEPIALPHEEWSKSEVALISGCGASRCTKMLAERMQFKTTKLMPLENCKKIESVSQYVHNTSLCTPSDVEHGICTGDFGSPLVSKKKERALLGIASWYTVHEDTSGEVVENSSADVFTAVYPHLKWINKILDMSK